MQAGSQVHAVSHALGEESWMYLFSDESLGARQIELKAGSAVYEADMPASDVFFIEDGQIQLYQHGPEASARLLEILGAGDWFGEAALGVAQTYAARAIAASQSRVWAAPGDALLVALSRQPMAAARMIRQLAGKLKTAREDADRLVFDDCGARLVSALLRFSGTAAATPQNDGAVALRITHRQLAQAVGAARETVSLALTQLRQQNLLRTGRNRVVFHPEALRTMSVPDAPRPMEVRQ